jgi:hypothetical protein
MMPLHRFVFAVALCCASSAHAQQLQPAARPSTDAVKALSLTSEMRVLEWQPHPRIGGRAVARDPKSWTLLWGTLYSDNEPDIFGAPPSPFRIDFSRHMVLAVVSHHIQIEDRMSVDSIGLNARETIVVVRHVVGCGVLPAGSARALLVTMPRRPQPVRFVERVERECSKDPT